MSWFLIESTNKDNSNIPLYAKFQHMLKELGMMYKHIFKENLMMFLWQFWWER